MHKKSIILFILSFYCLAAFSQNTDSITLVTAKWDKSRISRKVRLITHHFNNKNLFLANQNISYVEVKNKGKFPLLAIGSETKELKTTSTFGKDNNATVAINGTFFDVKNGGSVDFVKVDGQIIAESRLDKRNNRSSHQKAAITIENGKLTIKKWDGTEGWEHTITEKNAMVTGPLLTINNIDEDLDSSAFNVSRHPRSAIGLKRDGKIILLTIDGRNANSAGVSLTELKKVMKWLGCTSAINLDGGGSTTLWVKDYPDNGVINYPTDNKLWDHYGERKVSNVILIKKKP